MFLCEISKLCTCLIDLSHVFYFQFVSEQMECQLLERFFCPQILMTQINHSIFCERVKRDEKFCGFKIACKKEIYLG
jgi:hypothetical protein